MVYHRILNIVPNYLKKNIFHLFYLVALSLSYIQYVGSSSLTRDQIQAPSIGSTES